ncbi:hypothetical protein [Longimicrobium sp.]|uniref:hypothetical protein n=1 Tax=Longimicrobium sp. TaxID=2029185 RepID=UPI002CE81EC8|nr:hypothetical protein [Longimicrobium sp.]HSU15621.1 hypothetical protein [Longimicrobium sp.]
MERETISRDELHRRFTEALAAEAPDGGFAFDLDRCVPGADGCNWYPLAQLGDWRGDVDRNLAAFRRVRARLAESFNLPAHDPADSALTGTGTA